MITHLIISGSTPINNDDTLRSHHALTPNYENSVNSFIEGDPPTEQSCDDHKEHFVCIYDSYTSTQSFMSENYIFHEPDYKVGSCVPGTSTSHENDYHGERYSKETSPINNNVSEKDCNVKLRKRKFIIEEEDSTGKLSSSDNSNGESNIKITFDKDKNMFPTIPTDLLSIIPDRN